MSWQPTKPGEQIFQSLSDEQEAALQEHARTHMPPTARWQVLCHPVAVAVWRERQEQGVLIHLQGPRRQDEGS